MTNKLRDLDELMFRQIHPSFYQLGKPASDRFRPGPKDGGMLSVDQSSKTSAEAAHALYTSSGRKSAAVFAVSVGEFRKEGLSCYPDPLLSTDTQPANPSHALVNYSEVTGLNWKNVSKILCKAAIRRGVQFLPDL